MDHHIPRALAGKNSNRLNWHHTPQIWQLLMPMMSQKGDPLRAAGPQTCYLLTLGLGLPIWALLWVAEDKEGCTRLSQSVQVGAWYVPTVISWLLPRLPLLSLPSPDYPLASMLWAVLSIIECFPWTTTSEIHAQSLTSVSNSRQATGNQSWFLLSLSPLALNV